LNSRVLTLACALAFGIGSSFAAPVSVLAQTAGSISGTVTDLTGQPLGNARVTITGPNVSQVVATAPNGTFSVNVPEGIYSIAVSANGFQGSQNDNVVVAPGQGATVAVKLSAASLETIGRVTTNVKSINTTSASTNIQSGQTYIDQGQTQVKNILDQIPGVEIQRSSSAAPGGNSSISIRGAQPYESQILIDGHPVVSSGNGAYGFNGSFINSLLLGDVEVSKGPGNMPNTIENAIGGSLNFKTPAITGGPTGRALIGYDSFDGDYFGALFSDTFGKLGVAVGVAQNRTPGYLPQNFTALAGAVSPTVTAGTAYNPHIGVVNFAYPATQNYLSNSQLAKIAYNFSPQTSVQFSQYTTQVNNDETGTNYQYVSAQIVPCINTHQLPVTTCPPGDSHNNYTSNPNLGYIGQTEPLNIYAPYPNTTEFDNEPIYSGEFRTVIGPGSFLARYYTGTINRTITQGAFLGAVDPCTTPACPNASNYNIFPSYEASNSYDGAPYIENTIDVLHGLDAQYSIPFGANNITFGFDRHVDASTFGEYDPSQGPPSFPQNIIIQSLSYSLRGAFALTPQLTFEAGLYESSTTYVGNRFDPRGGLVFKFNPNAAVRLSYASAYAAPYYALVNPSSYVSQGTLNLATQNFLPETSSGFDLGSDIKLGNDNLISTDLYTTNIFNRYASVTTQTPGTFQGTPYTMITQNGNQANVRQEGFEFNFLHSPAIGLGFHTAVDLLRDYAYDQTLAGVSTNSIFGATVANNAQLPYYPFSKIRNDLFYTFGNTAQVRFSSSSYGQNNAYGQAGFTTFDVSFRTPLQHGLTLNIGGTNIFNHDNYGSTAIYDGGYTFPTLAGGTHYTTYIFTQPRTLFIQLERAVGPNGNSTVPSTSL
jgi:outer membrane receptor protein involved in Fe transport